MKLLFCHLTTSLHGSIQNIIVGGINLDQKHIQVAMKVKRYHKPVYIRHIDNLRYPLLCTNNVVKMMNINIKWTMSKDIELSKLSFCLKFQLFLSVHIVFLKCTYFDLPFQNSSFCELENTTLQKQRQEIQLLMGELKDRDRELSDMAAAHQQQLLAWEQDRHRLATLDKTLVQYEGNALTIMRNEMLLQKSSKFFQPP